MRKACFSKVYNDTTWNSLVTAKEKMELECVPLSFEVIITISMSIPDFNFLKENIKTANQSYLMYTNCSITDENGILHCIEIKNKSDNRKIILYTAGRTFPLYAAACI